MYLVFYLSFGLDLQISEQQRVLQTPELGPVHGLRFVPVPFLERRYVSAGARRPRAPDEDLPGRRAAPAAGHSTGPSGRDLPEPAPGRRGHGAALPRSPALRPQPLPRNDAAGRARQRAKQGLPQSLQQLLPRRVEPRRRLPDLFARYQEPEFHPGKLIQLGIITRFMIPSCSTQLLPRFHRRCRGNGSFGVALNVSISLIE